MKEAVTVVLLSQHRAELISKRRKEFVAAVADRLGEVRAIRPLEIEHDGFVVQAKAL
jgi:hypothetical protein